MKRIAIVVLIGVMVMSLLSGCASQGSAAAAGGKIKIGAFYPMTGTNAIKGKFNKNGTELAIEEINKNGGVLGKQLEVVYEDTQGRKENAPNVVRKLIDNDKVVALLGEVASSVSIAAGPVVKQFKVPAISPTSTNVRVTLDPDDNSKVNDYFFRACFIDPLQGAVLANFGYNDLHKTKAAVLYNLAQDYNKALAQEFMNNWKQLGGTIVDEETYPDGTQNFKPQLTKIKNANPEIVVIPNTYADNGLILKQAKELGLNVQYLAGDSTHAPGLAEVAGKDAAEGIYVSTLYAADDPDPKAKAFADKYKARFNEDPNSNAAFSYEATIVLAEAIKKAGKADPQAIRAALEQVKDVQVPSGTFTMDPKTHNPLNKPVVVLKMVNGDFKFQKKVTVNQ